MIYVCVYLHSTSNPRIPEACLLQIMRQSEENNRCQSQIHTDVPFKSLSTCCYVWGKSVFSRALRRVHDFVWESGENTWNMKSQTFVISWSWSQSEWLLQLQRCKDAFFNVVGMEGLNSSSYLCLSYFPNFPPGVSWGFLQNKLIALQYCFWGKSKHLLLKGHLA